MNITRGKQIKGQRVVAYGPEGIGKSTLASEFPRPVFIDTEGSTDHMDVARTPRPTSWTMLKEQVKAIRSQRGEYLTLVIDTVDWAERLCEEDVIASAASPNIQSIEDFGYGKGFTMSSEKFGKLLNYLNEMKEEGWNIVLTAHAQMRKFEQPDEIGSYDRYELKLGKKSSAMVKEWADAVLFCNYKTLVVEVDGKKKGQGGQRVIYTSHHPCWDAKNRWGLESEIPMDYKLIAPHVKADTPAVTAATTAEEPEDDIPMSYPGDPGYEAKEREAIDDPEATAPQPTGTTIPQDNPGGFPTKLWGLMQDAGVSEEDVRKAVALRGYYPENTPIDRYDDKFVDGVLVAKWDAVLGMIREMKGAA